MTMQRISHLGLSAFVLSLLVGGCDAGTTGRQLAASDAGTIGGQENGGQSAMGGATNSTGGTATGNGGTNSQTETGGTNNQPETGGSPSTGGSSAEQPPATGGNANPAGGAQATGGALATGGVQAAGGAQATGGLASAGGDTSADPAYYTSGPLQGYFWTAVAPTTTTITPADFSTHTPGTGYCVSGSVAGMTDYSGYAMVGYNVNQAKSTTVVGTWAPASISSGGVTVNITNNTSAEIRVQIQDPSGGSSATDRWCATVTTFNQAVTIPWSRFNTTCWNTTGVAYAGQALEAIIVMAPGSTSAVAYSFCVNSISAS